MAQMRSGGTTVGDALRGILDAVERRDPEMVASARNSQAWRTAADDTQLKHTDAVYTVPGTQGSEVVVYVDSNIWAAELGLQAELLRLKMNMALQEMHSRAGGVQEPREYVRKMRFAASRSRYRSARPEDTSTAQQLLDAGMSYCVEPLPLSPEEERWIDEQVAGIESPAIRKAARAAMREDAMLKKALKNKPE